MRQILILYSKEVKPLFRLPLSGRAEKGACSVADLCGCPFYKAAGAAAWSRLESLLLKYIFLRSLVEQAVTAS